MSAGPGGGGCGSDPDVLQALFSAAAGLCKVLSKHITAAITATLKHTTGETHTQQGSEVISVKKQWGYEL